uniref:Uncharacterized protein n=1 Tax=Meloidogyne incognita TaxID=6306 RepID=A0A914P4F6_MELIC
MKWLKLSRTDMGMRRTRSDKSEENRIKDKALKESKEKLKHARRIDKHGNLLPLDSQSAEEEDVAEEESFEKEEEGWDEINRKSPVLDLDSTEEIIPTEEIFDEKEYEQSTDDLIKEKTVTLIEEKESHLNDLHSDIEFEYLDSIDRFR